ncbi:MAG TPA: MlaA family lipoprotein [Thermodesulfovibrionales bacterium]|nr:MlaA family lipoprotein [Thermodesulfovibrionales bacterium]
MKSVVTRNGAAGCLVFLMLFFLPVFVYADADIGAHPAPVYDEGQPSGSPAAGGEPVGVKEEGQSSIPPDTGADPVGVKDEVKSPVAPDIGAHPAPVYDKRQPPVAPEAGGEAAQEEVEETKPVPDPFESLNRFFFGVNDKFYFWLLKPVAQGYNFIVPEVVRVRVRNAFQNITMPVRFVNSLLQLKMKAAGIELARFLMNSTIGFGGLFDLASRNPNLPAQDADFGQTLGVYGFGEGFYIVLPLLGPSSLRDGVGRAGDTFLNPVNYVTPFFWDAVSIDAYELLNRTSLRIGEYEDFKESAVDPYTAMKNAYTEHRRHKIKE